LDLSFSQQRHGRVLSAAVQRSVGCWKSTELLEQHTATKAQDSKAGQGINQYKGYSMKKFLSLIFIPEDGSDAILRKSVDFHRDYMAVHL
jgi:hypothetical protein